MKNDSTDEPEDSGVDPESGEVSATAQDPTAVQIDSLVFGEVLDRLGNRTTGFERYILEGEIARGGMGAIEKVWDTDLRRHMAMKIATGGETSGASQRADTLDARVLGRFIEEAQVTGQLDHPGIVPVHEIGLDAEGRMYFTMQLVRGRDLKKVLALVHSGRDEEWTQTRAVNALLSVCDAMAYAHAKGVLHRDLKPANIMVGRFGEVYVMDWGLARIMGRTAGEDTSDISDVPEESHTLRINIHGERDSAQEGTATALETMEGDVMGTPAYMPPEQARARLADIGPPVDIYAVGAILYHLLTGHPPHYVEGRKLTQIEVLKLVLLGPPEPIHTWAPEAPEELCAICEKAMSRKIEDRYASMEDLGRDLRAYLEGRVVKAYETGAVAEFRKWVARNKELALTAIGAALILVTGLSIASVVLARKNTALSELTRLAEERAAKVLRLADVKRVQQLRAQADTLWPADPEHIAGLNEWLVAAGELVDREPLHLNELEEFRALALPPADSESGGPAFRLAEEQWQHDTLAELVDDLASLRDPEQGLVRDVERRLSFASSVEERTVSGAEPSALWSAAIASIADPSDCPAYAGLQIAPQLGLIPIGRDPRSGLWEFGQLQTGKVPERHPVTDELVIGDDTGLVLVLLPGGRFTMGAQSVSHSEASYDPRAKELEGPPRELTLAPFFIAKHEMTQGQWLRFTGENPSVYSPGESFAERLVTLANPVEQVSWDDCVLVLSRLGLALPTEAQWEFAARGGTQTPWSTGATRETLIDAANLADRAAVREGATWAHISDWPELDDGHAVHARVSTKEPNPFGLHHVHGNLWEWCRDHYLPGYEGAFDPVDGERVTEITGLRALRGGSYYHAAFHARSSHRNPTTQDKQFQYVGVRPVRRLESTVP